MVQEQPTFFLPLSPPIPLHLLSVMTATRLLEFFGLLSLVLAVSAISCDTSSCKPPACMCPSLNPPGGILPTDAPQFVTLTFDDAIQPASYQVALELLSPRNHNGCQAKGTWFATVQYCNPALAQRWYSAGNEVAGHTFNHIGVPSEGKFPSDSLSLTVLSTLHTIHSVQRSLQHREQHFQTN